MKTNQMLFYYNYNINYFKYTFIKPAELICKEDFI